MRILLIQLRRVGDILLTTPVISYLKSVVPQSSIDFLSEPCGRAVLETHPELNQLLIYNKSHPFREMRRIQAQKYDAVLDFMNNPRTAYLAFASGARWRVGFKNPLRSIFYNIRVPIPLGPEYVPKRKLRLTDFWLRKAGLGVQQPPFIRPKLYLTDEDRLFAEQWVRDQKVNPKKVVILAPVHRHPIRQWRLDGFQQLGRELSRLGFKIYMTWGPGEENFIAKVRAGFENELKPLPLTTIRQMAALFLKSRLLITNDSGAMHVAVAMGTPTVTIYGPTRPVDWNPSFGEAPSSSRDTALFADGLTCLGCHLDRCPIGHLCMEKVSVNDVLQASQKFLKES